MFTIRYWQIYTRVKRHTIETYININSVNVSVLYKNITYKKRHEYMIHYVVWIETRVWPDSILYKNKIFLVIYICFILKTMHSFANMKVTLFSVSLFRIILNSQLGVVKYIFW